MRSYHKLSIILKAIRSLLVLMVIVYCLYLSTDTIFCLFDRLSCCSNEQTIINMIDIKKFVFDTYIITFIMMLFVVLYYGKKDKLSLKRIFQICSLSLFFLPISALLNYNFMILGSLMCSFYLLVITVVIVLSIDFIRNRIDKLYDLAVGVQEVRDVNEVDKNRKGENKKCKRK